MTGMVAGAVLLPPSPVSATDVRHHVGPHTSGNCARVAAALRGACERSVMMTMPVTAMGVPAPGGAPLLAPRRQISLATLHGPRDRAADVSFTLVAATGRQVIGGAAQDVLTLNGSTPGPTLTVTQGDLVEVRLVNQDVAAGLTLHWHGIDVPGAEDGVAGVTEDAVPPGGDHVYRFVVPDAGTYWYHSHQLSTEQVARGLVGAIVVLPAPPAVVPEQTDVVAVVHTYGATTTINGLSDSAYVPAAAGTTARIRFVNTDSGAAVIAASSAFRVAAQDGFEVRGPTSVAGQYVLVPAGGRADLSLDVGTDDVRVGVVGGPTLVVGPDPAGSPAALVAGTRFDPATYGAPDPTATAAWSGRPDRTFTYRVGQRTGFLDGRRGTWFTINGRIIPQQPIFVVRAGELAEWRIVNTTALSHPMHLHGHHWLVVSRNGQRVSGSPWVVDSLEVGPRETYVVRVRADNPGVWMFHCHNLPHAQAGLMTILTYDNVRTPFTIGRQASGRVNRPE